MVCVVACHTHAPKIAPPFTRWATMSGKLIVMSFKCPRNLAQECSGKSGKVKCFLSLCNVASDWLFVVMQPLIKGFLCYKCDNWSDIIFRLIGWQICIFFLSCNSPDFYHIILTLDSVLFISNLWWILFSFFTFPTPKNLFQTFE